MAFQRTPFKRTKRSKTLHKPTIQSLPSELLIEVIARVGSASITDLANLKLTCKELNGASDDDHVLEHLSMDKFHPIPWRVSNHEETLLRRCRECGNADVLYRQGMIEFFSHMKLESGLENLRRAAEKGHVEACYVYGIVLICCGGEEEARGMKVLSSMKSGGLKGFTSFGNCRDRVRILVGAMWMNNRLIVAAASRREARTCSCYGASRRKRGWEDNEEEDGVCWCRFDREVEMFCNILLGRS